MPLAKPWHSSILRQAPRPQFATFTVRVALPVAPAESCTVTVTLRLPFGVPVVLHGIDTGPFDVVLVVAIVVPPTLSVYVLLPAAAFSIQIVNQAVPLSVAPSAPGCVMYTVSVPGGGGGGVVFITLTVREAVAVRPAPSRTVRFSVWLPSATLALFQV